MANIRILATEDDPLHEEMLRVTLHKLGYTLIDVIFKPADVLPKIAATKTGFVLKLEVNYSIASHYLPFLQLPFSR